MTPRPRRTGNERAQRADPQQVDPTARDGVLRATATGVAIAVRVVPRAGREGVDGIRGDAVVVRLVAPPVEGAANQALIALLARLLATSKRAVVIEAGLSSRVKRVHVEGVSVAEAREALNLRKPDYSRQAGNIFGERRIP